MYIVKDFTTHPGLTCDNDGSGMLGLTDVVACNDLVLSTHLEGDIGYSQYLLTIVAFDDAHFGCSLQLVVITQPLDAGQWLTYHVHP